MEECGIVSVRKYAHKDDIKDKDCEIGPSMVEVLPFGLRENYDTHSFNTKTHAAAQW